MPMTPTKLPGVSRRQVVISTAAIAAFAGWKPWSAGLAPAMAAAPVAAGAVAAVNDAAVQSFLAFSKAITGHDDVQPATAARIHQAMLTSDQAFAQQLGTLSGLLANQSSPQTLLAAATDAGLRDVALAVVAAWYTGTAGQGEHTSVVSYEQALMYRPVADGLSVPTYCNFGPLWWTKAPPAVGVATPQEVAAASLVQGASAAGH